MQLKEKLYDILCTDPMLGGQIMRSGNHSNDELLELIQRFDTQDALCSLLDKFRHAFAFEVSARKLQGGYGLDFLMPFFVSTQNIHVCIMFDVLDDFYFLRSIDLRVQGRDIFVFCVSESFGGVALKQEVIVEDDDGSMTSALIDTKYMSDKLVKSVHDIFQPIYYDFVLDCILKGLALD